jgi:2-(3-amino-3-carboxypropyl)histidine synthase
VGVSTTVQHLHNLPDALAALAEQGIEGLLGSPEGRLKYPGQVLGCCYSSAVSLNVEEHLFIGTGSFHPLGLALATGRRVVAADPVTGAVSEIDPQPMLRRRFAKIARARESRRFAVLVSKKPGQRRMRLARQLKEAGEARGLEMVLVYLDVIEPDRLLNLGVEAAVCTACPRIALDDADRYSIPLLTPPEFEILLGERQWEEYEFDEME